MRLTSKGCASPINRDHTSIFTKIKACVKPIQNTRILTGILVHTHFESALRRALGRDRLVLRQLLVKEAKPQDRKYRCHTIIPAYFFTFLICPAAVADGDFVNAKPFFGNFHGKLRFKSEAF